MGRQMSNTGTPRQTILRRSSDRPVFARIAPPAGFVSQAILDRTTPRSAGEVAGAYAASARASQRRLPPGYRTALLA